MVVLISSDSVPYNVDANVAQMIQALVPQDGKSNLDELVTSVDIESNLLRKILDYCERRTRLPVYDGGKWDEEFFENSPELTREILKAAHWLDIPPLVEAASKALAGLMAGKSVERMKEILEL